MALTTDDLFRLEAKARLHADGLRRSWADDPAASPALRAHAEAERADAKAFDAIGDLLLGLQGCWDMGGAEMVRDGFKRQSRAWDRSKTYVLAVEAKLEADEAVA